MRTALAFLLVTALIVSHPAAAGSDSPPETGASLKGTLLVSAASSLTTVFSSLVKYFEAEHPDVRIRLNFGGSAMLATQIERGAPVGVFAAAGRLPIENLLAHDARIGASVMVFARGELVLVSKREGTTLLSVADSSRPLAMGNPRLAPAGAYAERSLQTLGLEDRFHGRLVLAENVRQVLRYVETGAVAAGLVYRTDVASSSGLRVTEAIPTEVSGLIEYPIVALGKGASAQLANAFVDFVCGPEARNELLRHGFYPISSSAAP